MSWQLERRDRGWFVIKDDGSSAGCHDTRADAIKHQRALYATESRLASMYAELDARPDPNPAPLASSSQSHLANELAGLLLKEDPLATELVDKLLKEDRERSLIASVAESQSRMAQHMHESQQERTALVAALTRMGSPIINVPYPEVNVHVPQAQVDVHVPPAAVTVNVPDVNVKVAAPQVTVRPEILLPSPQKTVTFERDPLTHQITRAEVTEA